MGGGPGEGTQSLTLGPLKPDLGPVQLSIGNSCDVGTSSWPHFNEANWQIIRQLITDRLNYEYIQVMFVYHCRYFIQLYD